MRITEVAKKISVHEKGKVKSDISQISEILKVLDKIMDGALYPMLRAIKK